MSILLKLAYCKLIQNIRRIFVEIEELILKLIGKDKGNLKNPNNFENEEQSCRIYETTFPDIPESNSNQNSMVLDRHINQETE